MVLPDFCVRRVEKRPFPPILGQDFLANRPRLGQEKSGEAERLPQRERAVSSPAISTDIISPIGEQNKGTQKKNPNSPHHLHVSFYLWISIKVEHIKNYSSKGNTKGEGMKSKQYSQTHIAECVLLFEY